MEYPLHMTVMHHGVPGFAVANDENDHRELSNRGFEPKLVEVHASSMPPPLDDTEDDSGAPDERAQIMKRLDDAGIQYDARLGIRKLKKLLPAD